MRLVKTFWHLLIMFMVVFSHCDDSIASKVPGKEEESTLILWHQLTGHLYELMKTAFFDPIPKSHPQLNFKEERVGNVEGSLMEKVLLLSHTGEPLPHLGLVERHAIPILADRGLIIPLDSFLDKDPLLKAEEFPEALLSSVRYKSKVWALPLWADTRGLFYNPSLLSQKDLEKPPGTWAELKEAAQRLTLDADGDGSIDQWGLKVSDAEFFLTMLWQDGQALLKPGSMEILLEPSRAYEVSLFLTSFQRPTALMPLRRHPWDPLHESLEGGHVAMEITYNTALRRLKKSEVPFASTVLPTKESKNFLTDLGDSEVLVLFATPLVEEAWKVARDFFTPSSYLPFARSSFHIPPTQSLRNSDGYQQWVKENPSLKPFIQQIPWARSLPLSPGGLKISSSLERCFEEIEANLTENSTAYWQEVKKELEEVLRKESQPASKEPPPYRVLWAHGLERVWREEPYHQKELKEFPAALKAARNEYEPFQIIVQATRGALEGVEVEVKAFQKDDGEVIPKENLSLFLVNYTYLASPLIGSRGPDFYPDALLPFKPFSVDEGKSQPIWLRVYVPEDVSPGLYRSEVTIRPQGAPAVSFPLSLEVMDFALLEESHTLTSFGLNYGKINNFYHLEEGTDKYKEVMGKHYWFLVERRISPYSPPVPLDSPEASRYLDDPRVKSFIIPYQEDPTLLKKTVNLVKDRGWHEKGYFYLADEPFYHTFERIKSMGQAIHSLNPSLRTMVTTLPHPYLYGTINIWCTYIPFLPVGPHSRYEDAVGFYDLLRERRDKGDEAWWYTAGALHPFPTLHIEDEPVVFRIIPWLMRLYDVTGLLHWETANWVNADPLKEPYIEPFGNGEGVLLYPGSPFGLKEPLSTIRLELLREGLEDGEYLWLLKERMKGIMRALNAPADVFDPKRRLRELCRSLIEEEALKEASLRPFLRLPHFSRDPSKLLALREKVAAELLELTKEPYVLVRTTPEENLYTSSSEAHIHGLVQVGTRVFINENPQEVGQDGSFEAKIPLSQGKNYLKVEARKGKEEKRIHRLLLRL